MDYSNYSNTAISTGYLSGTYLIILGDKTSGFRQDYSDIIDDIILDKNPDCIIGTGDMAMIDDNPDSFTYATCLAKYIAAGGWLGSKFWSCVGNHDIDDALGNATFLTTFSLASTYYSKVVDNIEIFFYDVLLKADETGYNTLIESQARDVASFQESTQGVWFLNALAISTARWKIVVFHQPSITSSSTGSYTPGLLWDWYSLNVDLIINGDKHFYERLAVNTGSGVVPHITNGLGGLSPQANVGDIPETQAKFNSNLDVDFAAGAILEIYANNNSMYIILNAVSSVIHENKDTLLISK